MLLHISLYLVESFPPILSCFFSNRISLIMKCEDFFGESGKEGCSVSRAKFGLRHLDTRVKGKKVRLLQLSLNLLVLSRCPSAVNQTLHELLHILLHLIHQSVIVFAKSRPLAAPPKFASDWHVSRLEDNTSNVIHSHIRCVYRAIATLSNETNYHFTFCCFPPICTDIEINVHRKSTCFTIW